MDISEKNEVKPMHTITFRASNTAYDKVFRLLYDAKRFGQHVNILSNRLYFKIIK